MKKSIIIALSLTTALVSCKKEKTNEFTPTDVTGTTVLKGNLSKNIVTPSTTGTWTNTSRVAAQGVNVTVKVNKSSLYPNSNAMGADIYQGTSDKDGNYAITVRTNATGVSAQITIDGFTGTQDTVINGNTRTGLYCSYAGFNQTRTLFMGQNSQLDYGFNAAVVSTNPNTILKIGTAKVTGSVGVVYMKQVLTGTLSSFTSTTIAVANRKVYLNFSNDPNTLATKMYEVTTDGNGYYTFDLSTVASNTGNFSQDANIWVADYATTRDTIMANGIVKPGRPGVFQMETAFQGGIYNNHIRNANHLVYSNFTLD